MFKDLVLANRSYRRFDQSHVVDRTSLCELIELATLSASSGNLQPLRYVLSCDPETNAKVFPHVAWAGYLTDWDGPAEGERPSAYIVIVSDSEPRPPLHCDVGIAAQSILLGAVEKGLGGCMIGSIQKRPLREALGIDDRYTILLVIAIGKPAETVVLDPVEPDGDIKYWRDDNGVHHVPKRSVNQCVIA